MEEAEAGSGTGLSPGRSGWQSWEGASKGCSAPSPLSTCQLGARCATINNTSHPRQVLPAAPLEWGLPPALEPLPPNADAARCSKTRPFTLSTPCASAVVFPDLTSAQKQLHARKHARVGRGHRRPAGEAAAPQRSAAWSVSSSPLRSPAGPALEPLRNPSQRPPHVLYWLLMWQSAWRQER